MADSKIDGLSALTGVNVTDADQFVIFDTSTGVTKSLTRLEYLKMLAVGSTIDYVLTSTGDGAQPTFQVLPEGGLKSVQVFTSSGTWTRPAAITKVKVYVTGGGEGGDAGASDGGGAGGTAIKLIDVSAISSSTVTIGAGGTGAGTDGGNSSWADGTNTLTGVGGGVSGAGQGGTPTGGDININGGSASINLNNGPGAASYWGGGSESKLGAFGAGGGEGASFDGVSGVIYVEEYA